MTKRAKTVEQHQIPKLARFAGLTSNIPESAVLRVCLSYYAGMRSKEIADTRVSDMTNSAGVPADRIQISSAKSNRIRTIPMHPLIKTALLQFMRAYPHEEFVSIARKGKHGTIRKMNSVSCRQWFKWLYKKAGLVGCSSHSGRRTFATELAQSCGRKGGSLRDVQDLLGHARLNTTQVYLECSGTAQDLVSSLGGGEAAPMLGILERTELMASMKRLFSGDAL